MKIELDTNNLTDLDRELLAVVLGGSPAATPASAPATASVPTPAPAPAKKAAPAKAAPAKVEEPTTEPEETPTSEEAGDTGEEDLVGGDGPTMSDAVAAATKLVSSGGAAKVKAALAEVGAKRVSEMSDSDIPAFLAALEN